MSGKFFLSGPTDKLSKNASAKNRNDNDFPQMAHPDRSNRDVEKSPLAKISGKNNRLYHKNLFLDSF